MNAANSYFSATHYDCTLAYWRGAQIIGILLCGLSQLADSGHVIIHEHCHLREHNHGPRYYRLLSQIMPGWESVKGRLDGMAELILNE